MKSKSFITKAIAASGLALALSGTAFASASGYWTVTSQYVSERGNWSSDGNANFKQTNSNYASFNGDVLPNWFGYTSRLVNSNGDGRSSRVDLVIDQTTHAGNNTGQIGFGYLNDIRSKSWDGGSSNTKTHFSSDWK